MLEFWTKLTWNDLWLSPLVAAAKLVLAPTSRTYWPFLLTSLLIAIVLWVREEQRTPNLPAHLNVFSAQTWWSVSAREDYLIVFLNVLLVLFFMGAFIPNPVVWVPKLTALFTSPGTAHFTIDPVAAAWLLALALFLVDDFLRFLVHWCEHNVPCLWELHKVHHSARVLNFTTAERHHPLALFIAASVFVSGAIAVNVLCAVLLGSTLKPVHWLGANVFWVLSNLLAAALRHSPVWLSYGPTVERWLISPAQHQIHHSENPEHFGKNIGSFLSVWDRLFGTLYTTQRERQALTFGLGEENFSGAGMKGLFWSPLVRMFVGTRQAAPTRLKR